MPRYKKNIIIFKRCTDDVFVIWKKQVECYNEFEELKKIMNTISNINCKCKELNEKVTFSHFDISINR